MDISGVLHMQPPSPHKIRAAVTQAEVTALSAPVLEGAEVDASFKVAVSPSSWLSVPCTPDKQQLLYSSRVHDLACCAPTWRAEH